MGQTYDDRDIVGRDGDIASPNFSFLSRYDALLVRFASQAQPYALDDPNTAVVKLRQFAVARQGGGCTSGRVPGLLGFPRSPAGAPGL